MITRGDLLREFTTRANAVSLPVEVPMDGAIGSDIAIIAEAPGVREKETRLPLVGGSGALLWEVLKAQGVYRQQCYITNVIKRQVSLSTWSPDDDRIPVAHDELMSWVTLLHWELAQLPNIKHVLLLGNFALEALTKEVGVSKWRGSVIPIEYGPIGQRKKATGIISLNPAAVRREPKLDMTFRFDINKLKRVRTDQYPEHKIEHLINPSFTEAMQWLDKMQDEGEPVSYDIETIANETACIGFANDPHVGMCIAFRGLRHNVYSREEELALRRRINLLLGDPQVRLVAQNGNFDAYWLWYKDRIAVHHNWFDTLLAHHALYPALPHNLGYLTAQYTTHPFYKEDKQGWKEGGDIDRFWRYNVKDVCITLACQRKMLRELQGANMEDFYFNHIMRLQPHLTRMTVQGLPVDMALKDHIVAQLDQDLEIVLAKFHEAVGVATGDPDFKPMPNNRTQMGELYFRRLKLVGRGTSTDKANRIRMADHPRTTPAAKDVLHWVNRYAKEFKFNSVYAKMRTDGDRRARTEYKQFGTQSAPGRLSSAGVLWGTGTNLQNQPQRAQPMFVAPEGYCFGYFDLEQAEARYVGWDAGITTWIEQFERARVDGSYDCHRALASEMFGVPYEDVPKFDFTDHSAGKFVDGLGDNEPTIRFIAKRCRHGLNYRMAPMKLAETTHMTLQQATQAYHTYHRLTPELRAWWDALTAEVKRTQMLFSSYGRRLVIIERITEEALESIVAFKPQSTIGDKVNRVIYMSEEDDRWPADARIVLNIHDSLICLAPHAKIKTCLSIMKEHAEEPLMVNGMQLIIPASCKISTPIAWEAANDDSHAIKYIPREDGLHRWYGMKSVQL